MEYVRCHRSTALSKRRKICFLKQPLLSRAATKSKQHTAAVQQQPHFKLCLLSQPAVALPLCVVGAQQEIES